MIGDRRKNKFDEMCRVLEENLLVLPSYLLRGNACMLFAIPSITKMLFTGQTTFWSSTAIAPCKEPPKNSLTVYFFIS